MVVAGTDRKLVFCYGVSRAAGLLSPNVVAYWQRERVVAGPRNI